MMSSGKKAINPWNNLSYDIPKPYLRPRIIPKGEENQKRLFVVGPGDGPEYKFSKEKKGGIHAMSSYGKDAKIPPVSYLPLPIWAKKKEDIKGPAKTDRENKGGRGTFIDDIYFDAKKYNKPGPSNYFASNKNDLDKKEDKSKLRKPDERPSFLMDYQYLGMNNPGPGSYKLKDTWEESAAKRKEGIVDKKKPVNVSQSWKVKNDQGHGPGQYDIVRLMTLDESGADGNKKMRKFKSIPIFNRALFGIINKVNI